MERAAAAGPKRIPTLTGEKFIETSGQGWRTESRKDLWCPHYFSANSSSADRIQAGRGREHVKNGFPHSQEQLHNHLQDTKNRGETGTEFQL